MKGPTAAALGALLVLGVAVFAAACKKAPTDEELLQAQVKEVIEKTRANPNWGAARRPDRPAPQPYSLPGILADLEGLHTPPIMCAVVARAGNVNDDDRVAAFNGLAAVFDDASYRVKICIVDAFVSLGEIETASEIYRLWSRSTDPDFRAAAETGQTRIASLTESR